MKSPKIQLTHFSLDIEWNYWRQHISFLILRKTTDCLKKLLFGVPKTIYRGDLGLRSNSYSVGQQTCSGYYRKYFLYHVWRKPANWLVFESTYTNINDVKKVFKRCFREYDRCSIHGTQMRLNHGGRINRSTFLCKLPNERLRNRIRWRVSGNFVSASWW